MKTTDLMIGDWVYFKDKPIKIRNIFEEEINLKFNKFSGLVDDSIHESYINPIPLTSEILEKNGFEKNRDYGYYIGQSNSGYHIYFDNNYLSIQAGYDIIEFAWCEHVHELQHALNLCGIEKEIVL